MGMVRHLVPNRRGNFATGAFCALPPLRATHAAVAANVRMVRIAAARTFVRVTEGTPKTEREPFFRWQILYGCITPACPLRPRRLMRPGEAG